MNQQRTVRSEAERNHEIDVTLQFVSAVQHVGRYHRHGLSVADAIEEASAPRTRNNPLPEGRPASAADRRMSSEALMPGEPSGSVSILRRLDAWTLRMAETYNDGERWPHPEPLEGWPQALPN